jgi:Fungal specific transcription factor domain
MEDLRLLHYYTVDLAHTLSLPGAIGRTWADGVPRLAFGGDHEYLVHALLAMAAAHKASQNPSDIQSRERGQLHYGQSLALLQKLDLKSGELHASAALAAVMLLTWYEVPTHINVTNNSP